MFKPVFSLKSAQRALGFVTSYLLYGIALVSGRLNTVELLRDRNDRIVTRLCPPLHGDSSGVRGAAWLWPA